jgi:hypothetical protein
VEKIFQTISVCVDRYEDDWFAASVPEFFIKPWIDLLEKNEPEKFDLMMENKFLRDGKGKYHVTVITPPELSILAASGKFPQNEDHKKQRFILEALGIGKVQKKGATVFYLAVKSADTMKFREQLGLDNAHFTPHITLGFEPEDVHGVDKSSILWRL